MHKHNLVGNKHTNPTRISQLINDNNNYVNLHDVTNLELYSKLILVTQKQVLELYITAIERKTLYSLHIPHTALPNALQPQLPQLPQLKQQQTRTQGPCYFSRNNE